MYDTTLSWWQATWLRIEHPMPDVASHQPALPRSFKVHIRFTDWTEHQEISLPGHVSYSERTITSTR